MTDQDNSEQTAGGLVGKIAGKAKEAAGALVGNDSLAREGRLQQAQADAELKAADHADQAQQLEDKADLVQESTEIDLERRRLRNEVAAQEREQTIERDRRQSELQAQAQAQREQAAADQERDAQERAAQSAEQLAERSRLAAAQEEIALEQRARRAETTADTIDPSENQ